MSTPSAVGASGRPRVRPRSAGHRASTWLLLLTPPVVFLVVFFVIPVAVMLYRSFYLSPLEADGNTSFTLANYTRAMGDFFYFRILLQTLALGVAVTIFCLVLSYPFAYFLARTQTRWRQLLFFLVVSPLVVGIVIRSFGWMVLLGRAGTINQTLVGLGLIDQPLQLMYNWLGVVIALTHVLLPFMVLTLASVIEGIPRSLEETAAVLGAGTWARFSHVLLPLSMEGIGAGVTLVFMLAIGSFVSVMLVGGADTQVLPLLIYQQVLQLNNSFASALGLMLLTIALSVLYIQARAFRVRGTSNSR